MRLPTFVLVIFPMVFFLKAPKSQFKCPFASSTGFCFLAEVQLVPTDTGRPHVTCEETKPKEAQATGPRHTATNGKSTASFTTTNSVLSHHPAGVRVSDKVLAVFVSAVVLMFNI